MERQAKIIMPAAYRTALLIILTAVGWGCGGEKKVEAAQETGTASQITPNTAPLEEVNRRIEEKAKEALAFCQLNDYNTDFAILIDMSIHSGKYRMFIYDFNRQEIERKALCAHGSGRDNMRSTGARPLFGNVEGSLLTSLGKYRIGTRSYSQYGINVHYKLHGLEESNSNAFRRIIVLHSHTPVPSTEMYPAHMPMGWSHGCPVTDNETMTYLDIKLRGSNKPVLLWIYY
jgi:hypothetical protein